MKKKPVSLTVCYSAASDTYLVLKVTNSLEWRINFEIKAKILQELIDSRPELTVYVIPRSKA